MLGNQDLLILLFNSNENRMESIDDRSREGERRRVSPIACRPKRMSSEVKQVPLLQL